MMKAGGKSWMDYWHTPVALVRPYLFLRGFMLLLCRLIGKRLREIDEKVTGWRIMAGVHPEMPQPDETQPDETQPDETRPVATRSESGVEATTQSI